MNELGKYEAQKKKLQGICDENDLTFRIRVDTYPITLTVRPIGGVEKQLSMLEMAEETGYTNPEAKIVFSFSGGNLEYHFSEQFTIGDALYGKIKTIFTKMYLYWCQHFFHVVIQNESISKSQIPEDVNEDNAQSTADDQDVRDAVDELTQEEAEEALNTADDAMYQLAAETVRASGVATVSELQKKLSIGYAKAARLLDALEVGGVIGRFKDTGPREVFPFGTMSEDESDDE